MVAPVLLALEAKAGGQGQPHIYSEFGIHENHLKNKRKNKTLQTQIGQILSTHGT